VAQIYKASNLTFYNENRNRRLGINPSAGADTEVNPSAFFVQEIDFMQHYASSVPQSYLNTILSVKKYFLNA